MSKKQSDKTAQSKRAASTLEAVKNKELSMYNLFPKPKRSTRTVKRKEKISEEEQAMRDAVFLANYRQQEARATKAIEKDESIRERLECSGTRYSRYGVQHKTCPSFNPQAK